MLLSSSYSVPELFDIGEENTVYNIMHMYTHKFCIITRRYCNIPDRERVVESDSDNFALSTNNRAKVKVATGEIHTRSSHFCREPQGVRWPTNELEVGSLMYMTLLICDCTCVPYCYTATLIVTQ